MGIRYWGQPLPAHLIETVRTNPRLLLIDDDYDDYLWRLREGELGGHTSWDCRNHALDLDKVFNDFQALWHTEPPEHRPAIELVRGTVTNTDRGWKSYYGVVDPNRVAIVREDIARTGNAQIETFVATGRGRYRGEPDRYTEDLVARRDDMITFLDERLTRGEGVLYTIG